MMQCEFCGSSFGDRKCYFCEKICCTSCMTDDHSRCKQCFIKKRKLKFSQILKKNKILLGFIGFLWFYTVYPGPFIPGKRRPTDLGWTWKIHPSKAVIAAPRSGGWPTDKLVSKSYKPGFPEEGCLLPAWVRSMLNRKPECGIRFRKRSHTA